MTYSEKLEQQLHLIDRAIEDAKRRFESADVAGKVEALASLQHLRGRHDELERRMADAKKKGADTWSSLHESFQEEADALKDSLQTWFDRIG